MCANLEKLQANRNQCTIISNYSSNVHLLVHTAVSFTSYYCRFQMLLHILIVIYYRINALSTQHYSIIAQIYPQ